MAQEYLLNILPLAMSSDYLSTQQKQGLLDLVLESERDEAEIAKLIEEYMIINCRSVIK